MIVSHPRRSAPSYGDFHGNLLTDLVNTAKNPDTLIDWVSVESEYGPTMLLKKPKAPGAPPAPGQPQPGKIEQMKEKAKETILQKLKPRFVARLTTGHDITYTPYGRPGETKWPIIATGLAATSAVILGFAVYGGYCLWKGR